MDHTTPDPALKDFEGIRGKKPAHYDHQKKSGGSYEEGGGTGFNLQDGVAGTGESSVQSSSPNSVVPTPSADSGEVSRGGTKVVGGVDFSVPPFKEND